jgi:transposase
MKHIGMDVHSTTTDVSVLNKQGKEILYRQVRSSREELVGLIKSMRGSKRATVEESQMADWVARAVSPHVDEFIRCQPRHNRLVSRSESKNDRLDARRLAKLLWLDELKPVHHPDELFRTLRQGVRGYWRSSWDLTRSKNQLKDFYLFHGIHCSGKQVYSQRGREARYRELAEKSANLELARCLYLRLDQARDLKAKHIRMLGQLFKPVQGAVRRLMTIPGVGRIGAYTLVAYLERGWRFKNKRELWQYGGLGKRESKSRGKGTEGAAKSGNRRVKNVVMTAAASLSSCATENALWRIWKRGVDQGMDPRCLRRTVARKVLVIAQCLLRTGREYDDERVMISQ